MATAGVATRFHPDWHDIKLEADYTGFGSLFNLDRDRQHLAAKLDFQFGCSISHGIERCSIATADGRIGDCHGSFFADITRDAVCMNSLYDDKLTILVGRQIDVGGVDVELHERRLCPGDACRQ